MRVIVAGGGIGGMVTALSLHAAGITDIDVYESAPAIRELGVGITLQSHAVRELTELGLLDELYATGIPIAEQVYFTKRGQRIGADPRGLAAGHRWPQFAIHRGELLMLLYRAVLARLGAGRVHPSHHLAQFGEEPNGTVWAQFTDRRTGEPLTRVRGEVLIGADGVHSVVRRTLHPWEGPPLWTGVTLWRGITEADPFLGGCSAAFAGHWGRLVVVYPISQRYYAQRGRALVNWVAAYGVGDGYPMGRQDWDHRGQLGDVLEQFGGYRFDWLDLPELFRRAKAIYQYPMVDRDPLSQWGAGPVTLLGMPPTRCTPTGVMAPRRPSSTPRCSPRPWPARPGSPRASLATRRSAVPPPPRSWRPTAEAVRSSAWTSSSNAPRTVSTVSRM